MGFPLLIVMIICTVSLQLIMTSCSGNEHETTHKHTNTHTHTAVIQGKLATYSFSCNAP